jgi:hypothetical protein
MAIFLMFCIMVTPDEGAALYRLTRMIKELRMKVN